MWYYLSEYRGVVYGKYMQYRKCKEMRGQNDICFCVLFLFREGKKEKMREEDYRGCRYIDVEMRFYTFEDFLENAHALKRMFLVLNHKIFYKWYVYSHIMSIKRKDKIWEFLNDDISYEELLEV